MNHKHSSELCQYKNHFLQNNMDLYGEFEKLQVRLWHSGEDRMLTFIRLWQASKAAGCQGELYYFSGYSTA
jgi:hypothetical protein